MTEEKDENKYVPGDLQMAPDNLETVAPEVAKVVSNYYHSLIENGIHFDHVLPLSVEFQRIFFGGFSGE